MTEDRPRRWPRIVGVLGIAALLVASVVLLTAGLGLLSSSSHASDKMTPQSESPSETTTSPGDGERVVIDDPPSERDIGKMKIEPVEGDLTVPSVNLASDIKLMSEVDGVINPPGLHSAYMLRGHGTPEDQSKGTIFVAMHSVRGADLPGNKLFNINEGTVTVHKDDKVTLQGKSFTVTDTHVVDKPDINTVDGIWDEQPGKLVLMTCLQRPTGLSQQNIVIEATAD